MQVNSTGVGSFAASAALGPYLRVKRDATYGLVVAGAEDRELGTLRNGHIVSGLGASEYAPVVLANAMGTVKMVAADAITQWATVYGAAGGKIDDVANANPIGIALEAATADEDYIEVLRMPAIWADCQVNLEVPAHLWRVHDAIGTNLPVAAANDDLGLVNNTFGTSAPTVEAGDLKAAGATNRYGRFQFAVPPEYLAGDTITLRANAGMKTTVADTTCTLDAEVYRTGAPSVDICATAAQDMNNIAAADLDFTITPTNVVAGEILDVRLTVACNDAATGTAVIPQINSVEMRLKARV